MFRLLAAILVVLSSATARADQVRILGVDSYGNVLPLPQNMCVRPGQEVRLLADAIDNLGRRYFLPAEQFTWRLTQSSGQWDQWAAGSSPGYGPFRRGFDFPNVIYVQIPVGFSAQGPSGDLIAFLPGNGGNRQILTDPSFPSPFPQQCEWANPDIYSGGLVPPPSSNPAQPCFGVCRVGAACTDGCPPRGRCRHIPANPPYWRVTACR